MEPTWCGLVEPQLNGVIYCFNLSKEVPELGAGKVWHRDKEQGLAHVVWGQPVQPHPSEPVLTPCACPATSLHEKGPFLQRVSPG